MAESSAPLSDLTARERDMLALVAGGMSNDEIAEALKISVNTVKTTVRVLYRKIGVQSRVQAMLYWQRAQPLGSNRVDALQEARRTVAEALAADVPSPSAQRPPAPPSPQRSPAKRHAAGPVDHLRRDLEAGQTVVRDLPAGDLRRVTTLLEMAQSIARSESRPVRLETVFAPPDRVVVRIRLEEPVRPDPPAAGRRGRAPD